MHTPQQQKARKRAMVIMQVRSGQLTATEAARILGVSRKTYYQWEQRALQAMLAQLEDRPPGRPENPSDPEKEALEKRLRQAEKELAEARQVKELRRILDALPPTRAKKKIN